MEGEIEGEMDEDKHPQPLVAVVCMYLQICVYLFTHLIACLWDAEVGAEAGR